MNTPGKLTPGSLPEVVYRQLMYLVIVQSVMTAAAGARLPWHKLTRTGISVPAAGTSDIPADRAR